MQTIIFQSNFKQSYRAASQLANRTSTSTRKNDTKRMNVWKTDSRKLEKVKIANLSNFTNYRNATWWCAISSVWSTADTHIYKYDNCIVNKTIHLLSPPQSEPFSKPWQISLLWLDHGSPLTLVHFLAIPRADSAIHPHYLIHWPNKRNCAWKYIYQIPLQMTITF